MTTLKHPFDADSLVILASKILKAERGRAGPFEACCSGFVPVLYREDETFGDRGDRDHEVDDSGGDDHQQYHDVGRLLAPATLMVLLMSTITFPCQRASTTTWLLRFGMHWDLRV